MYRLAFEQNAQISKQVCEWSPCLSLATPPPPVAGGSLQLLSKKKGNVRRKIKFSGLRTYFKHTKAPFSRKTQPVTRTPG